MGEEFGLDDAAWDRIEAQGEIHEIEQRLDGNGDDSAAQAAEIARLERELEIAQQQRAEERMSGEEFGRSIADHHNRLNGLA